MSIQKQMIQELKDKEIFELARTYAYEYLDQFNEMDVYPTAENLDKLKSFHEELSEEPKSATDVLNQLQELGSKGTVAHTGGRYFGFVLGGATPISLATKWMTDVWDQCGGLYVSSPINAELELLCEKWLKDLFNLPSETVAGFVSGASMANFCAMTAARYHLLKNMGWDVNTKGLQNAPAIRIICHEQLHANIKRNLVLLGLGIEQIEYVAADKEGRMRIDQLPKLDATCLVFLQAGNVNSGSFDNFDQVCSLANDAGAWVHIDGAFGIWAAACKSLSHLTKGIEKADSWAVDAHKTLNVPYDSGIVLCKHPNSIINALQASGDYIIFSKEKRDPIQFTTEMSKRSRAIEMWATMKYLGKNGIDEMVTNFHLAAKYLAEELLAAGFEVLNEVVFNQVLIACNSDEKTKFVLDYIQKSGVAWLGGSIWHERSVIRISVSSWRTDEEDLRRTVELFKEAEKSFEA